MRRSGWIVLACLATACSSGAGESVSATTTTNTTLRATTNSKAAAATTPVPTTDTIARCSANNDALSAAKTFVAAAEAGDKSAITRCKYPATPLGGNLIAQVAQGGWLLDQAGPVQANSYLKIGPDSVGFDFPLPPETRGTMTGGDGQPISLGPDLEGGMQIAVTKEPDGRWYVTDLLFYTSG